MLNLLFCSVSCAPEGARELAFRPATASQPIQRDRLSDMALALF